MPTPDEIDRRVEEADTARHAKRSAAAQQIGELAQRRAIIAEQLDDVERELGDVLAVSRDVMDIDELARFTDVPAADLTRWLTARKATRTKRKKPTPSASSGADGDMSQGSFVTTNLTADQASTLPESPGPRGGAADAPERVAADVT
jgi:hypothetical protein